MKRKLLISSGKQNKQLPKKLQTPTPFNNTRAVSADILLTPRRVRGTAKGERFQLRCANRPFISLLTFNAFHSPGHQVSLSLSQGFLSRSSSLSLQWAPAEGLPPSCSCRSSWERSCGPARHPAVPSTPVILPKSHNNPGSQVPLGSLPFYRRGN